MENCLVCGDAISIRRQRKGANYCSGRCAEIKNKERYKNLNPLSIDKYSRSTSSTGAAHELIVCAYLMKLGYHVFRSQSPSCPCDLIAMISDNIFLVEVTTGLKTKKGYNYPSKSGGSYKFDILAVVFHDGEIKWFDKQEVQLDL